MKNKLMILVSVVMCILIFLTPITAYAATSAAASPTLLNKSIIEAVLQKDVKNGTLSSEQVTKLETILDNSLSNSSESSSGSISPQYQNPTTGAQIYWVGIMSPPDICGILFFNNAGWNIIRQIINFGGGTATVGAGVLAYLGVEATGGLALIVGGAVVAANAAVNIQFSLGHTYAYLPILVN
jgi:hypothetical protein